MEGTLADPLSKTSGTPRMLWLFLMVAVLVIIAETLGPLTIPLGAKLQVVLSPFLWALILGAIWGVLDNRLPTFVRVDSRLQAFAAAVLEPALLVFIAKLGLLVGGSLPKILNAGWALVFQEFGHFFGTMVLGLPIALFLGIKREAIGATFSVGREPSLAIIGERFGMSSPEGHGVLAEYLTGTIFGTVFIALLAGVTASLGIFHPHALAMGAGVGSGSIMAAAVSAIAAQQPPEASAEIAAFAAASNLATTTIGTYFTLLLSLPFTIWAYGVLEPIIGRRARQVVSETTDAIAITEPRIGFSLSQVLTVWVLTGIVALIGDQIAFGTRLTAESASGAALILVPALIGYILNRLTGGRLPVVLWVSLVAMAMTCPGVPYASQIAALTGKINFLALATPIIALAGLSVARNMPVFRRLGWRIVVVSLCANAGTFIGATLIAQIFASKV